MFNKNKINKKIIFNKKKFNWKIIFNKNHKINNKINLMFKQIILLKFYKLLMNKMKFQILIITHNKVKIHILNSNLS